MRLPLGEYRKIFTCIKDSHVEVEYTAVEMSKNSFLDFRSFLYDLCN